MEQFDSQDRWTKRKWNKGPHAVTIKPETLWLNGTLCSKTTGMIWKRHVLLCVWFVVTPYNNVRVRSFTFQTIALKTCTDSQTSCDDFAPSYTAFVTQLMSNVSFKLFTFLCSITVKMQTCTGYIITVRTGESLPSSPSLPSTKKGPFNCLDRRTTVHLLLYCPLKTTTPNTPQKMSPLSAPLFVSHKILRNISWPTFAVLTADLWPLHCFMLEPRKCKIILLQYHSIAAWFYWCTSDWFVYELCITASCNCSPCKSYYNKLSQVAEQEVFFLEPD